MHHLHRRACGPGRCIGSKTGAGSPTVSSGVYHASATLSGSTSSHAISLGQMPRSPHLGLELAVKVSGLLVRQHRREPTG